MYRMLSEILQIEFLQNILQIEFSNLIVAIAYTLVPACNFRDRKRKNKTCQRIILTQFWYIFYSGNWLK